MRLLAKPADVGGSRGCFRNVDEMHSNAQKKVS